MTNRRCSGDQLPGQTRYWSNRLYRCFKDCDWSKVMRKMV